MKLNVVMEVTRKYSPNWLGPSVLASEYDRESRHPDFTHGQVEYVPGSSKLRMPAIGRWCQLAPFRVVRPSAVKYH
jgi:hypothetical protein